VWGEDKYGQKKIVNAVGDKAVELGYGEWFIFDTYEDGLAQGGMGS